MWIAVLVPISQSGNEVRLRRPDNTIMHGAMIGELLQQHGVERGRTRHLAHRQAGKLLEQTAGPGIGALSNQEIGVGHETGNEGVDVVAELGVVPVDVG